MATTKGSARAGNGNDGGAGDFADRRVDRATAAVELPPVELDQFQTVAMYMYEKGILNLNTAGYGAAIAWALFVLIGGLSAALFIALRQRDRTSALKAPTFLLLGATVVYYLLILVVSRRWPVPAAVMRATS